jgi:SAM-dependent methyltransferase
MPISDELEALRQSSRVKTQSTRLSDAASKHNFTTPQQQEELRKAKLEKEKQLKLEAERAWRSGATTHVDNLQHLLGNGLYGRLMDEHRRKTREAQQQMHAWKGRHQGKGSSNKDDDDDNNSGADAADEKIETDEGEEEVISNAAEMLPDHVVQALKEKYETTSIEDALTKALKEEESGALSKVMMSAVSKKEDNGNGDGIGNDGQEEIKQQQKQDDREVNGEKDEDRAPDGTEKQEEQEVKEEQKAEEQEQENKDKVPEKEVEKQQGEEEAPVKEVRERIEQLTIDDTFGSYETAASKEADTTSEEANDTASTEMATQQTTSASTATASEDLDPVEQTKLFYNKHAIEFIANMVKDKLALTPTRNRDLFLQYLEEDVHPVKKTLMTKLGEVDASNFTIIDLGCGYGRDTLYFSSLGHHVLAVDYSYSMIHHGKTIAPNAHYLNMDMRSLKNLLIDQSVDGVWAHASLSHLPKNDLVTLLKGLYVAIKVGGVLYFSVKIGTAGEVVEADTRYTPKDSEQDICKLYSYYTSSEVVELVSNSGWEVMKIGESDLRELSDYPTHSLLYVFATRRKD